MTFFFLEAARQYQLATGVGQRHPGSEKRAQAIKAGAGNLT